MHVRLLKVRWGIGIYTCFFLPIPAWSLLRIMMSGGDDDCDGDGDGASDDYDDV